eukprot:Platyproteum_vivax@DN3899_c0_g1_i2.p1
MEESTKNFIIIFACAAGGVIILGIILGGLLCFCRRRKQMKELEKEYQQSKSPPVVRPQDVVQAAPVTAPNDVYAQHISPQPSVENEVNESKFFKKRGEFKSELNRSKAHQNGGSKTPLVFDKDGYAYDADGYSYDRLGYCYDKYGYAYDKNGYIYDPQGNIVDYNPVTRDGVVGTRETTRRKIPKMNVEISTQAGGNEIAIQTSTMLEPLESGYFTGQFTGGGGMDNMVLGHRDMFSNVHCENVGASYVSGPPTNVSAIRKAGEVAELAVAKFDKIDDPTASKFRQ